MRRENQCTNTGMMSLSNVNPTYRDGGLDELLDLALSRVGPQGPEHLAHLGHLEHGSRDNNVGSQPP